MTTYRHQPAHYVAGVPIRVIDEDRARYTVMMKWNDSPIATESEMIQATAAYLSSGHIPEATAGQGMLMAIQIYDEWWESVSGGGH